MPVVKAALLGIPLPLCSCGVLPTAVSLRRQGASKGAVTSFLIATPQTGVDSIAATYSLLGLPFALLRPVGALLGQCSVVSVCRNLISHTKMFHRYVILRHAVTERCQNLTCRSAVNVLRHCVTDWLIWSEMSANGFVIGLVIAALITVLVPDELFLGLADYPLLAMLMMVVVSVPMYVCATGSIPIALSLIAKGLTPGVGFVLLMAGPAANFASMMILSKSIGRRSTLIYAGSVIVTSLVFGLMIDYLLPREWFMPAITGHVASCHEEFGLFETLCSVVLLGLLAYTAIKSNRSHHSHEYLSESEIKNSENYMKQVFNIEGMECAHCAGVVRKAVSAIEGIENVSVDHTAGTLIVEGNFTSDKIKDVVYAAGFAVKG